MDTTFPSHRLRRSRGVQQNQMARSVKSFSELQRQAIGVELGRRETANRKPVADTWLDVLDEGATPPAVVKEPATDR